MHKALERLSRATEPDFWSNFDASDTDQRSLLELAPRLERAEAAAAEFMKMLKEADRSAAIGSDGTIAVGLFLDDFEHQNRLS